MTQYSRVVVLAVVSLLMYIQNVPICKIQWKDKEESTTKALTRLLKIQVMGNPSLGGVYVCILVTRHLLLLKTDTSTPAIKSPLCVCGCVHVSTSGE